MPKRFAANEAASRSAAVLACALAFSSFPSAPSLAQAYPSRVVTIFVPFASGGAADVNARVIAEGLTRRIGQTVIVENVPGAGGTTGSVRAKSAPKDGYTLLLGHMGTQAAAVSLYPKLSYDPRADFEPIGLISFSPILVFARADLPASTLPEFLDYARAQGSKVTDGHSGVGSISHITCALLASLGRFKPTYVPYRGVGPMMNDMLGGNVDYGCDLVLAASPQVNSGALKGIAVAARERSPAVSKVPTSVEGGLPDFQADAWIGLFAPKGTPAEALDTLRAALAASLDDPAIAGRLTELGAMVPKPEERTPDYLSNLVKSEIERWGKVIKESGISLN